MEKQLLHYLIRDKIGEGGMGEIYLAQDTRLKRDVALKFLPKRIANDQTERKRLEIEAQAAAVLNHPNIAQVYAIEEHEDQLFIVMEFVEGIELFERLKGEALSNQAKLEISIRIMEAIDYAHQKGIIHRDIKSRNIMIPDSLNVKVMDFGLARVTDGDHITKEGTTMGTTAYMAPELLKGSEATAKSDIWSVGVLLYEIWAGALPFQGMYDAALVYSITNEDPVPFDDSEATVPPYVQDVILKCLAKEEGQRAGKLEELIRQLKSKRVSPSVTNSNEEETLREWLGTRKVALSVIGAILIATVLMLRWNPFGDPAFEKKYLAVLPIENLSGSSEIDAICLGLAETLSHRLSDLEIYSDEFWVAPARELRRESIETAKAANEILGVNLAILSSIQNTADSTRLILELVDAAQVKRIGTYRVSVAVGNYEALETEAIRAMLSMMKIEMSSPIQQVVSDTSSYYNPLAYESYLKGAANLFYDSNIDSLNKAVNHFQKAIQLDASSPDVYVGLGEAYWSIYETNQRVEFAVYAEEALNEALQRDPENVSALTMMGLIQSGHNKTEEAMARFAKALDLDPKNNTAYRGLAGIYQRLGNEAKAEETYLKAIELKPDYAAVHKDMASFYLNSGNIPKAIEYFKKVTELTPRNSTAYSNLGVAYYYQGDLDKARAMFEQSLALEKNPITASNLAGIYYVEGKYQQAITMYEIALEAFDNHYEIIGNIAAAYEMMGDSVKSQDQYLRAIEQAHIQLGINDQDEEVLANIAAYYIELNDNESALRYINDALRANENNFRVRQRAVTVFEELGMREQALKWITPAMFADLEYQPEFEDLVKDPRYRALKDEITN